MSSRPLFGFPLLFAGLLATVCASCASSEGDGQTGAAGNSGGAGTTGTAGTFGTAGTTGTGGTTGGAGTGIIGTAGDTGSSGTFGSAGISGTGGTGGALGAAGFTGAAGRGGATGAAGKGGSTGAAGTAGVAGATGTAGVTGSAGSGSASSNTLVGWAASNCSVGGLTTTTGGGNASPVTVTSSSAFNSNASGTNARVIQISGNVSGDLSIGSNKTIIGLSGAKVTGHIDIDQSSNVILKNLTVVGYNCSDAGSDCQNGADAITINHGAHHLWIDHLDVSDGSDGNLDITNASDCVTVSWTKFHYSASRVSGYSGEVHHFSNLVGASDSDTTDAGHLRVTWHHDWWADHVVERQPRIRFGQNHIFNSLYTSSGDNYCIGAAVSANILTENNVFVGVSDPINSTGYSNGATVVVSRGNLYTSVSGQRADKGTAVFTPPYPYKQALDDAASIQSIVQAGAGPK